MASNQNTFLITALGRCGTMFLATLMDQSKQWCVRHEPVLHDERTMTPAIAGRFRLPYYGEVNSRVRWIASRIPVDKLGVIIRDPREHAVSVFNKNLHLRNINHPNANKAFRPGVYKQALEIIDGLVQFGAITIRFEQMVSEPDYLDRLLWQFGITDIDQEFALKRAKRNTCRVKAATRWDELPDGVRKKFNTQSAWFREKYYGEGKEAGAIPNQL